MGVWSRNNNGDTIQIFPVNRDTVTGKVNKTPKGTFTVLHMVDAGTVTFELIEDFGSVTLDLPARKDIGLTSDVLNITSDAKVILS